MVKKIDTELTIDIEELAVLVAEKLQEGIVGALQEELIAFGFRLGVIESSQIAMSNGTDGLRVALQEWANVVPPEEPK